MAYGYLPLEWCPLDPIKIGAKDPLKLVDEKLEDMVSRAWQELYEARTEESDRCDSFPLLH